MRKTMLITALLVGGIGAVAPMASAADYPKPSVYPISWQLDFTHGLPQRIVVHTPGTLQPVAYLYMTYTITNKTGQERTFLPVFDLLTRDGKVHHADKGIPLHVFEAIKAREKNKFLEQTSEVAGEIRLGEDQARDGVAIWPQPLDRMGNFAIFVTGLSGEAVTVKDDQGQPIKADDGQPIVLRKTLQINYLIRGDEIKPGEDLVVDQGQEWIMR